MEINKPRYCIVHCSDVSEKLSYDQFKSINDYHRDVRFFPISSLGLYIGYHYLVTGGKITQCRLDTDVGAHCNQHEGGLSINYQSIGICWAGDGDIEYPSTIHFDLLQKKIWEIQDMYKIPNENVRYHRYYATDKTCPGSLLDAEWLSRLLKRPSVVPSASCTATEAENRTLRAEVSMWKQAYQWVDQLLTRLRG